MGYLKAANPAPTCFLHPCDSFYVESPDVIDFTLANFKIKTMKYQIKRLYASGVLKTYVALGLYSAPLQRQSHLFTQCQTVPETCGKGDGK